MASLQSPLVCPQKRVMRLPALPFTTVEDHPYIAPVLKVLAQFLVPVQTAAGHYKDEHVSDSPGQALTGPPVIFRGGCADVVSLPFSLNSGAGLGHG